MRHIQAVFQAARDQGNQPFPHILIRCGQHIGPAGNIPDKDAVLCAVKQLALSPADNLKHIHMGELPFLQIAESPAFSCIKLIQIRPALPGPRFRLLQPPTVHFCMVPAKKHLRNLCALPDLRSGILGIFQKIIMEGFKFR